MLVLSSTEPIGKWISILSRHHQSEMARQLEELGIGHGQFPFLLTVCKRPGLRQDKLTELLFLNKSSVARAVSQLESKGYLRREIDPEDGRAYKVHPTEQALTAHGEIVRLSQETAQQMTEVLSDEEHEVLRELLERMVAHIFAGRNYEETPLTTEKDEGSHGTA